VGRTSLLRESENSSISNNASGPSLKAILVSQGYINPHTDLRAAGIDRTSDKDGYYQFVGGLQDQLDQFQKDNKKVPKAEEVRKIGAQLMQEQRLAPRMALLHRRNHPTYSYPFQTKR